MNTRELLGKIRRELIKFCAPVFKRLGLVVLIDNYYSPVPDASSIARSASRRSSLAGIDMREQQQLEMLAEMQARFADEYESFPTGPAATHQYYSGNKNYKAVDAAVLYSMIRRLAPAEVIEVGSGDSTRLIAQAVSKNAASGKGCRYRAIDPYPRDFVTAELPGLSGLITEKAEDVPLSLFDDLAAGDILFIDSSHVLKSGGDVECLYLEVLPRLNPGVYVHVHDVYLPAAYPVEGFKKGYFLTEQYLLQAFLAFNREFEVVWGSHFMHLYHPDKLAAAVSAYKDAPWLTCSFWIKRKG